MNTHIKIALRLLSLYLDQQYLVKNVFSGKNEVKEGVRSSDFIGIREHWRKICEFRGHERLKDDIFVAFPIVIHHCDGKMRLKSKNVANMRLTN